VAEQFFVEPPVPSPIWNTRGRRKGEEGEEREKKGVRMIKKIKTSS